MIAMCKLNTRITAREVCVRDLDHHSTNVNHFLWPAQLADNKSHVLLFSEYATQISYHCFVLRTTCHLQRAKLCDTPRIASSHD